MKTKDNQIQFRCTTAEKKAIRKQALKEGRDMTSFILWACKKYGFHKWDKNT